MLFLQLNNAIRFLRYYTSIDEIDGQDSRVEILQAEILRLKREYNALAPLFRVPTEILCMIWIALQEMRADFTPFWKAPPDPFRHADITITHVCHRWRTWALSYPKLWTFIPSTDPSHIETSLLRSEQLPISARYYRLTPPEDGTPDRDTTLGFSIISQQLHRVSELRMYTEQNYYFQKILRPDIQQNDTLPLLEHLEVVMTVSYDDRPLVAFSVAAWFLSRHLPRLKYLSVAETSFKWWSQIFPSSLTHLCLEVPVLQRGQPERCSWARVFECLGRLNFLERLELKNVLPISSEEEVLKVVRMTRLQHLGIHSPLPVALRFIGHIHLPSKIHINIEYDHYDSIADTVIYLKPFLRGTHTSNLELPVLSLALDRRSSYVHFCASRDNDVFWMGDREEEELHSVFSMRFEEQDTDLSERFAMDVCQALATALTNIQALRIGIEETPNMTTADVLQILQASEYLQCIGVRGDNIYSLIRTFEQRVRNETDGSIQFLFPNLWAVTVLGCTLPKEDDERYLLFKVLSEEIRLRKARGFGPFKLIFKHCEIDDGNRLLQDVLSSVIWIDFV